MKKEREEHTLSCMIVLSEVLSKRNAQTDSYYLLQLSLDIQFSHIKSASGTTQCNHISDQITLKDITNLFQREKLLSNHAAVFPWNGEDTHMLYPKLYPVGYSFGARLRLHWFVEGIMSSFSMKQSDYPTGIPGGV